MAQFEHVLTVIAFAVVFVWLVIATEVEPVPAFDHHSWLTGRRARMSEQFITQLTDEAILAMVAEARRGEPGEERALSVGLFDL